MAKPAQAQAGGADVGATEITRAETTLSKARGTRGLPGSLLQTERGLRLRQRSRWDSHA